YCPATYYVALSPEGGENVRKYETVFILNPDSTEEKISDIVNKVTNIIENYNGDIEGIDHWGRKKLAYEINKKSEGYFILINFLVL
ncbi:30S ribosomal protein S6, partial [Candidatus Arthromitus sp. SFB-5]